ncbi:MAG TPA: response regulator transcription factor [Candidatus Limnocylindria bacterium]
MVINWTRLLGSPRIAIHTQDPAVGPMVEEALADRSFEIVTERGTRRHDGVHPPHIVFVDLATPHSIEILRSYTQGPNAVPAIAVLRAGELQPRLAAFANGADDVVTFPMAAAELGARVRALLKRCYGERLSYVPAVKVGDLEIDVMRNHVKCGETRPDLTSTEQAILFVLASNAGHTVSRESIRHAVWGSAEAPPSNIVDRHVRSLRSKLGDSWRAPRYIATVRQHGYRLVPA